MATRENCSRSGSSFTSQLHISHHHHIRRHRVPSGGEEQEEEELDPRIQTELEKLNRASEEINRLELELDDARAAFRQILSDSTNRLNELAKRLGTCVEKSRPYYDARMRLKEAHLESQKAVLKYERSCSMHEAAKEMVQLAEEGYKRRERDLDPTWQEMLNHATMKVNEAERERIESEEFHQKITTDFKRREQQVQQLERDLKRAIVKSKSYFDMKMKFNQILEDHKRTVGQLEEDVGSAKALYSQALHSLEAISDEIHQQRFERRQKLQLGVRGAGVGAEAPPPPPAWEKGLSIEGSASSPDFDSDADCLTKGQRAQHSETILNVNQIKGGRTEGLLCYEPSSYKKTSSEESHMRDMKYRNNPQDVPVFKTSISDLQGLPSSCLHPQEFIRPLTGSAQQNRNRSASYRAAIESSEYEAQGWVSENLTGFTGEDYANDIVIPMLDNIHELPDVSRSGQGTERTKGPGFEKDLAKPYLHEDAQLSTSGLNHKESKSRSLEPEVQKCYNLQSLMSSLSSLPDQGSSLSLMQDSLGGLEIKEQAEKQPSQNRDRSSLYQRGLSSIDRVGEDPLITANIGQSQLLSCSAPDLTFPQDVRPSGSLPELASIAPTILGRSPKLQGLILQVDAAESIRQESGEINSAVSGHPKKAPQVVICTQYPTLGAFIEKPTRARHPT